MSENFLEKITRYNLFNHLLPGVVFFLIILHMIDFDFEKLSGASVVLVLFFSYFLGTVLSRIGSVIVEPALEYVGFVQFAEYGDYLEATKVDEKLDMLSEENNVYRTYISVFLTLIFFALLKSIFENYELGSDHLFIACMVILATLFLFSYRKQTSYIRKRVTKNLKN